MRGLNGLNRLFGRRLFNSNEGHEILKQNKSYNYDDTLDILINEINNIDSKINKDGNSA